MGCGAPNKFGIGVYGTIVTCNVASLTLVILMLLRVMTLIATGTLDLEVVE